MGVCNKQKKNFTGANTEPKIEGPSLMFIQMRAPLVSTERK